MKHLRPAVALTLVFIALTGLVFPGVIWAIGQAAFPRQANGSLIEDGNGNVIGCELIGQAFAQPRYFHPRPSAAGDGYDAANSGGTNLGPTSEKLINGADDFDGVAKLVARYRRENGVADTTLVPSDAVTRSASGLDPDISVANAKLQANRVASARGVKLNDILPLIDNETTGRFLGVYGEPRVNVLKLNLALDQAFPVRARS